jgi:hypothetical protein
MLSDNTILSDNMLSFFACIWFVTGTFFKSVIIGGLQLRISTVAAPLFVVKNSISQTGGEDK